MAGEKFQLPIKILKFLEKVSKPLEEDIKQKKNKEMLKSDFLLTAHRTDHILERIYVLITTPTKTEAEKEQSFNNLINLLLALFSHVLLIYCIAVTGWSTHNSFSKEQEKRVTDLMKDMQKFAQKFIFKYRSD